MNKLVVCGILLFIGFAGIAQKKELTLNDAVLQQYRAFRPESLNAVQWVPGTDEYVYASDNYQQLLRTSARKNTPETWLTVQDVNKALGAQLYNFYGFEFLNANELLFSDGQNYYSYNAQSKTGTKLASLPEQAENAQMDAKHENVAFTKANNLYVLTKSGEKAVTSNTDPNIVAGQSIARNEFGIEGGIFWSPKSAYLAFYQKDESDVASYPLVDLNPLPAALKSIKYPMAGQGSEKPKVGIYNMTSGQTVYISPHGAVNDYLTNLSWSPDERFVLIAELNRGQNKMNLNVYDAKTGAYVRTILTEENEKWVEPEHPAFFPSETQNNFVWISEKDGFSNLYYYTIEGKLIKQLTANKFVAKSILQAINKGKEVVYAATGTSPLNTLYYAVDVTTGKQRCLTLEEGTHSISINAAGTMMIDQYSSHSVVGKSELKTITGKIIKTLLVSKNKLAEYKIGSADIGQIQGPDGSTLYTRMIKPSNFDPNKKYPVLVYVYGGPHAQMITNSWLDGASLWMYYMAEQGYIVFTLDNRGSGERGFAFESQIHRQLGTVEIEDQMKGVEYLKSLPYIDGDRLAVHGWSFGGFMTTSLMLRQAGTFNVGVAGGPVTDWKYYEVMYGERYMDTPEENAKGYEQASLFTHANKLKGDLLLIHGTIDDVVVPQHNYNLVKKFVELGIQMDFFPYPMHKHNVSGKDRVHLIEKVLKYVMEHNQ